MSENSYKKEIKKTSIGGQALIEGVMMKGPRISAMAIRQQNGEIITETWDSGGNKWYHKVPILRGIFNFIGMLGQGYKCLMRSADLSGFAEEEEPSKFDRWVDEHLGDKAMWVFNAVVTILAAVLCVGLFMLLPAAVIKFLGHFVNAPGFAMTLTEGLLKIAIFILYLFLVTRMSDIHRVFEYHGAEHKTIACYEAGDELTPENAKKYVRFHPRCGTSFLLIVLVISILVFSVVTWSNIWMRVALKILLLPVVIGISYEIIRYAGRHNNPFTRALSAPGLWLQRLTTFEPDLTQLEVAIAAMTPCIPENGEDIY
ncbi:DUF1385 domain-containing protein [Anaerotruncus sp. DFI.9.16]|uniref:DUF1385 domain-containing protein n=1 Tax=Anaerotruncus sp. DFI.9.16 TaxID=2965275 RepID=UPI00210C6D46|nr:DUF1385 domain-containing protein [Anaerotruncus sp. DFI.9.16]MCQ4897635.1 DUF1385 domain-containing protein [Anaerotruncus sp. DFI.9.16]